MKHLYIKSLLAIILLFMAGGHIHASVKINGLYYELNDRTMTASVTYYIKPYGNNSSYVSGDITIPSEVTYNNNSYQVTSIGSYAFHGCSSLTSVTILNSVTSIGDYAFRDCGLTSITIPNSVTRIGDCAFVQCFFLNKAEFASIESLCKITFGPDFSNPLSFAHHLYIDGKEVADLVIPESVTTIGSYAFYGCSSLTSITIPNSVTKIGDYAFRGCSSLTSPAYNSTFFVRLPSSYEGEYTIPSGITTVCESAFLDCTGLTSITIPNSVTSIGDWAFYRCSSLTSVTLPDNIKSIGSLAFPETSKIYVKRGTASLFALWNAGYTPYQLGTEYTLPKPYLQYNSSTQTTVSFDIVNYYADLKYSALRDNLTLKGKVLTISGLMPDNSYSYGNLVTISKDEASISLRYEDRFTTASMGLSTMTNQTASSITANGNYTKGDANVLEEFWVQTNSSGSKSIVIDKKTYRYNEADKIAGGSMTMTSLDPNIPNKDWLYIVRVTKGTETEDYVTVATIKTDALKMTTLQPKVITEGNVIVAAETNVDDEEVNVGFEWRRTDWTDDFASNTGGAYLYEGTMEGYIRNLNANFLWKVRPYYMSNSGKYYYGDWTGLDPSNTSYFEPTVHTYAKISVEGNTALVKGYALRGTDNVTVQGFKYWKTVAGVKAELEARRISEAEIPADALTVEAKGQVMTASLKDLDYESSYSYVAFVTTSEGETFYGEQQTFQTGIDTTPVIAIEADRSAETTAVALYDMQGRRISKPARGINILLMSDGSTRKVMVK